MWLVDSNISEHRHVYLLPSNQYYLAFYKNSGRGSFKCSNVCVEKDLERGAVVGWWVVQDMDESWESVVGCVPAGDEAQRTWRVSEWSREHEDVISDAFVEGLKFINPICKHHLCFQECSIKLVKQMFAVSSPTSCRIVRFMNTLLNKQQVWCRSK